MIHVSNHGTPIPSVEDRANALLDGETADLARDWCRLAGVAQNRAEEGADELLRAMETVRKARRP